MLAFKQSKPLHALQSIDGIGSDVFSDGWSTLRKMKSREAVAVLTNFLKHRTSKFCCASKKQPALTLPANKARLLILELEMADSEEFYLRYMGCLDIMRIRADKLLCMMEDA